MFVEYLKPLIDWFFLHPHWGSAITFLTSFIESLAIIGVVVPGIVILTAVGALVGSNVLPAYEVLLAAILGAFLGDTISFWVGYYYHERVRIKWPFYRFPYLITKGEHFFKKHGGKSIFLGRFAGPVRVITPVVGGMMNMSPWRFLFAELLACPLWAIAYLLPGILIGAASQELAPDTATRFLLYVVLLLLVLWCVSWLFKRIIIWILNCFNQLFLLLWKGMQSISVLRPLYNLLKYSDDPQDHTPLIIFISFIATVTAFYIVTLHVMHQSMLAAFNQAILHLMLSLRNDNVDKLLLGITYLAEVKVLAFVIIAVAVWLIWNRDVRAATMWIINSLLACWSVSFIKPLVHSLRPQVLTISYPGWSYPSGHSAMSIAIFGFLAVLMTKDSHPNNRGLLYTFAGILSFIIMSTRIYFGVHWLTDVIGGALLGLSCLLFSTLCYRPHKHVNPNPRRLFIVAFIALLLGWSYYFIKNYQDDLYALKPRIQTATLTLTFNEWWNHRAAHPLLYRSNRFGKSEEIINVEWSGDLNTIQQKLLDRGWNKKPKFNLAIALTGLTANNRDLQPPLITQLYHNQKPVLILTKFLAGENKQLILRLWNSDVILTNANYPLWVGTVTYHKPWQPLFLNLKKQIPKKSNPPALSSIHALEMDLIDFKWKEAPFTNAVMDSKQPASDWNGYLLLILQPAPTSNNPST